MVIKNKYTAFLYLFLFAGAFNDLLRLGTSEINLFRILLPFVFLFNLTLSKKARIVYIVFLGLVIISLVQSFIFSFSLTRYIKYLFFYFCIFTVITSVVAIYELDSKSFTESFESFIIAISICFLIVFIYLFFAKENTMARTFVINNQNDYGAVIVATMPIIFYHTIQKKKYLYFIVLILDCVFLVLNDAKLALLGLIVQIICVLILGIVDGSLKRRVVLFPFFILFVFVLLLIMHYSNYSLNGYTWIETIEKPIKAIINEELYSDSSSSVSFRTNTIIVGLQWIRRTKLLGIGIGNSGVLLRLVLGNNGLYQSWLINDSISLHNTILEFILEFGLIAVIGFFYIIIQIIKLLKKEYLTVKNKEFLTVLISSFFWILGPSGILTDYMIFALFTYLIIAGNDNLKNDVYIVENI